MAPADFLLPNGELDPDWFVVPPSLAETYATATEFVLASLAAWQATGLAGIDDSVAAADAQKGADAYAYYRAYKLLATKRSIDPNSQTLGSLGKSFSAEQLKTFREERDRWKGIYDVLAGAALDAGAVVGAFTRLGRGPEDEPAEYAKRRQYPFHDGERR